MKLRFWSDVRHFWQIDATHAGQHVFYKTFMPRNVNKAHAYVAEIEIGKTQIDRYAATFFFRESVGIFSGERLNKRTLAVVDMTCCADDDGTHLTDWTYDRLT